MAEAKIRALLDRAVERANQRTTAIQKGEYHPRIEVIRHDRPGDTLKPSPPV